MKQVLTHSRMQAFRSCRKKHYWMYETGLRRETDAKALRMGSAGHDALDALKNGAELAIALEKVRDAYAYLPDGYDQADWDVERETVECLVTGYEWRWGKRLEVVASEQEFLLPLVNPDTEAKSQTWDLAGKIDGIVRLEDGRLAVLEHKFISDDLALDSEYWRRLAIDPQISIYVWAARQLGHDVQTVMYDVVRKPTIRPEQVPVVDEDGFKVVLDGNGERVLTKQGKPRQTSDKELGYVLQSRTQTADEWGQKLLGDISNRPEWYYARVEIARLDNDIYEMLAETWDLQKTIRDAQLRGAWYKTVSRDTCTFCPYFGLCTIKFDIDTDSLPEGFVKSDVIHPELEGVTQ